MKTINGEDQPGTFDIDALSKDLKLALEQGSRMGSDMPLSTAAMKHYTSAQEAGLSTLEGASLACFTSGW